MQRSAAAAGRRAPRFFVDGPLGQGMLLLPDETAHHAVRVLRLRAGDELVLFDGRGGEHAARLASVQRLRVEVEVLEHRAIERESRLRLVLVQGVSSSERMELTIRKAVELGVAEIHPVLATASVARPEGERAAGRQAHWRKIAISACEQCGRNRIPLVVPPRELPLPPGFGASEAKILLSPGAPTPIAQLVSGKQGFVLAAGPEAGFDEREEQGFLDAGFVAANLGPRVLRTETAALAALAALHALAGDFRA
ncbi:MAG: 16S rRNA (uracil(1498)-N(3))-methyltransferase [Betaproteobacteria bacterium]|nr:16S rRNA (uracil(1498)-N(3))-methyltransferase [Betaproteobacteria bacterium]